MTLQSNALNFASYTRGSVDVRTGLYSFSLEVPPLNANFAQGPHLPLQLSFSPLNTANSGFGIGWAFKLSRYDLNNHVLSVHTGDTFEVADQGPGELALVYEQKFKAFTFKHIGEANKPRFRITHTNGMIEILEPLRADDRTFLPTRVETRSGLGITLAYDDEKGRLVSIEDDFEQPLLTLVYQGDTQVLMHVHPGSEAEQLFTLKLQGEELRTLVMPASDLADWTFHYDTFDGMRFLRRLIQPYGGEERIFYKESGHQYPGLNHYLPYVTEHQAIPDPQDDTAATIKTTYTYSDKNFLGYGATDVAWDEHYNQDQLYKATDNTYNYHTEVSHYLDDKVLRTVKHTFNRFHLMTEQVTDEAGCIQTLTTQYHDAPGNFASQDVRVQLPSKMTKTWTQTGTQLRRDEPVFTEYDTHGNLVREQFANGMVMVREFYLPEGEEGCPRDPDGFTRNLKSLTVYPAEGAAPAKILRSRCTYRELPVLSTSLALQQTEKWLVANSVQEFEVLNNVEIPLRREDITHLDMPDNPFLHGRVDYTTTQLGKTQSRTEWRYEKSKDDNEKLTYLLTTTTLKPHGGTLERTTYSLHSTLRDQLIETQDTNGVKTRYSYDAVNRPSAETVAPDKPPYDATRTYCYGKETKDQRTLWYAQVTDVNGVITRTYHDGLNRPIREERTLRALDDPESETTITRTVSETTYDTLGRVASETLFDYLPAPPDSDNVEEQVIELTSRFSYDAWGQRCQVEQPDRVKRITLFSPFGDDGNRVEQWQESPDKPGVKQQHSVVEYNRFNKPVYEYQLHLPVDAASGAEPVEVDRTTYLYDGLGQAVQETLSFAADHEPLITTYQYDHWGRLFETVRANESVLTRHFDERSTAELTTLLEVRDSSSAAPSPVCKRTFDGLERLTSLAVGPRLETYQYQGQLDLMESRTLCNTDPAGHDKRKHVERYDYTPELTRQPTKITATLEDTPEPQAANEAAFDYHLKSAEVRSANNDNGGRAYTYTDQGYLALEHWNGAGEQQYNIRNQHSLQGRLRYRKHSDGVACLYAHDPLGRVTTVTQGNLQATLTYNSEGRLETTTTCDTREPTRYVRSTQTYDDLGREHRRTLEADGQQQVLVLKWLDGNRLASRTLYNGSDKDEDAFLRKEVFEYDALMRLVIHNYDGKWEEEEETGERWQALPRNAKGRSFHSQVFTFNNLDKLTRCLTEFADTETDIAHFTYATDDSFQLTEVTHTLLEDYRETQGFTYDARGNMLNDEQGRTLEYDVRGRLERVRETDGSERARYLYDGHDQLLASVLGSRQVHRRYQDHRLDTTQEGNLLTQYLLGETHALAVQHSDAPTDPLLLLTDNAGSIITETDRQGTRHANYSAYGERPDDNGLRCLLAFNGEAREEALGWYLLGSGYRAYNPQLMRFHSPDSLAPEEAGLNPYLYALGNPVRWRDPTGHKVSPLNGDQTPDKKEEQNDVTGNLMGILVFGLVFIASVAITPWAGPVTFSFALTWGGIAAQGIGLGLQIAGFATKNDNPELSKKLAIAGLAISAIGVTMSMVGRSMTPRRSGPNSSSRSPSRSTPGSRPTPGSPGRDLREQMELTRMRIQERLQQIQQRRMPPPTYGSVMNGSAGARPVPSPPPSSPPSYGHATGNSVASQLSGNRSISGNSTPQSIHDNPVINTANTQAPYSRVSSPTVTPPPNRRSSAPL